MRDLVYRHPVDSKTLIPFESTLNCFGRHVATFYILLNEKVFFQKKEKVETFQCKSKVFFIRGFVFVYNLELTVCNNCMRFKASCLGAKQGRDWENFFYIPWQLLYAIHSKKSDRANSFSKACGKKKYYPLTKFI